MPVENRYLKAIVSQARGIAHVNLAHCRRTEVSTRSVSRVSGKRRTRGASSFIGLRSGMLDARGCQAQNRNCCVKASYLGKAQEALRNGSKETGEAGK